MGRTDLASALTTECHTGLCVYGHPQQCSIQHLNRQTFSYVNMAKAPELFCMQMKKTG